jgi:hypothetical protein
MYEELIQLIEAQIKANGIEEITGPTMQAVLKNIISSVGGSQFRGMAIPTTNPGIPTSPAYYLASQAGTYQFFNQEIGVREFGALSWDPVSGTWKKELIYVFPDKAHQIDNPLDHPPVTDPLKKGKFVYTNPVTGAIELTDVIDGGEH